MNKKQAIAVGIIIAELAVLDYCGYKLMKDGLSMEISVEESTELKKALDDLEGAEKAAEADMAAEGIELIEEGE